MSLEDWDHLIESGSAIPLVLAVYYGLVWLVCAYLVGQYAVAKITVQTSEAGKARKLFLLFLLLWAVTKP